jgi:small-conductance mechanosensitive channel
MDLNIDLVILFGWNALVLIIAVLFAKVVQILLVKLFRAQHYFAGLSNKDIAGRGRSPLFWLLLLTAIYAALPLMYLSDEWVSRLHTVLRPLSVASLGWLIISGVRGVGEWLIKNAAKKARDNLGQRRYTTQIRLLMRVIIAVLVILTIICVALVIPALREFGLSLFASAGLAGIVIGVASKEALSNLIAGVQLALTQQILLGDEVVVMDELGTIDEITSSYVVLKTWDLRRIIIPLRYFMENSFENLTYHEPDIIGTVFIYTDYTANIDDIRKEALRLTKASKLWDRKRCELLVTECRENVMALRVTVSAKNSSDLWDLRCLLREKLIIYVQKNQAESLPKTRVALQE